MSQTVAVDTPRVVLLAVPPRRRTLQVGFWDGPQLEGIEGGVL